MSAFADAPRKQLQFKAVPSPLVGEGWLPRSVEPGVRGAGARAGLASAVVLSHFRPFALSHSAMPIQLGDLTLQRVHRIDTLEQATLVHHRVPGAEGDVLQNLGRASVRLRVEGIFYGAESRKTLDALRALYVKREPVDFIADVVGQTYVSKVALDRLEVAESAGEPGQFSYALVVSEYAEPPAAGGGMDAVQAGIQADAALLMDVATLPDALALGSIPEISNPFVPLQDALTPVREATEALHGAMAGLRILLDTPS